jgi:hypothetical protein
MQVLLGLQSNALKFTMKGRVEIEISIIKELNSEINKNELFL